MSVEKVNINGAEMDKCFFEDNLKEAKSLDWEKIDIGTIHDHSHCIACTTALPNSESSVAYRSKKLMLCSSCYETYLCK
jgi:hypothetical protein